MEKYDAQISRVAVVKKAWSPWKKFFSKKISFQLICTDNTTKWYAEFLLKQMGLEIFNFRWFFGSEKLFFPTKLLIKLDRQKIKKIPQTF